VSGPAEVHRSQLGQVPVFYSIVDGPTRASLMFRVGVADESASTRGITHVVEHLTLYRLWQQRDVYNGSVSLSQTQFDAVGSSDHVGSFLSGVARELRDLPLGRLEIESRVLRNESEGKPLSQFQQHALLRYGFRGPGLIGMEELGLFRIDRAEVDGWAGRYFTGGNASVAWVGPVPPDGVIHLSPGVPEPATPPAPLVDCPVWATGQPEAVSVSFLLPRSTPCAAGVRILVRRLRQRLRYELGLTYDLEEEYEPISAELALALVSASAAPRDVVAVRDHIVETIVSLIEVGPTEEDLALDVEAMSGNSRLAEEGDAFRIASDVLWGRPVELRGELDRELRATLPHEVRAAFEEAAQQAILTVPDEVSGPSQLFNAYPDPVEPALRGRRYIDRREAPFRPRRSYPVVVVGQAAVGIEFPDARAAGMEWKDCVGVVFSPGGDVALLDSTGRQFTVVTSNLVDGHGFVSEVEGKVPPQLQIRPHVVDALLPPASVSRASLFRAGIGGLLMASIATVASGPPDPRWLPRGPNTWTSLTAATFLLGAALLVAMAFGARRFASWSSVPSLLLLVAIAMGNVAWLAGGADPAILWVSWVAAAFAVIHVYKVISLRRSPRRRRLRPRDVRVRPGAETSVAAD